MGSCRPGCIAILGYCWFLQWLSLFLLRRPVLVPVVSEEFESLPCVTKIHFVIVYNHKLQISILSVLFDMYNILISLRIRQNIQLGLHRRWAEKTSHVCLAPEYVFTTKYPKRNE